MPARSRLPRRRTSGAAVILAASIVCAPLANGQATDRPSNAVISARLDSAMNYLMRLDLSPGAGIVVVRDTQIVYMKGFGYADAEAKRPFTPETGFYIASTTKSFTGLAAALLDRKGAFKLDAPLNRYLPDLKLKSPLDADSITILSLLTHTHGITNGGPVTIRLAYSGEYNGNAELLKFLETHEAAKTGRDYNYGNIGYNVAALAMDEVTGKSWKDVLQAEVFAPLGMKRTSAYVSKFARADLATPYRLGLEGWMPVPYGKTDANMQSAGGLITTLRDMGTWLEVHINNGRVDGKPVLPAAVFEEAHSALAVTDRPAGAGKQIGYGLGWNIVVVGSDTMLVHGGGFPGFTTNMSFIPSRGIGVAIFANNGSLGGGIADIGTAMAYEILTGGEMKLPAPPERIPEMANQVRERVKADLTRRAARPQDLQFPLDAYTGVFENPVMGHLRIDKVGGKLEARFGAAWSAIEVFDNTKNQLRFELFGSGEVVDVKMEDGKAMSYSIGGFDFKRAK